MRIAQQHKRGSEKDGNARGKKKSVTSSVTVTQKVTLEERRVEKNVKTPLTPQRGENGFAHGNRKSRTA